MFASYDGPVFSIRFVSFEYVFCIYAITLACKVRRFVKLQIRRKLHQQNHTIYESKVIPAGLSLGDEL